MRKTVLGFLFLLVVFFIIATFLIVIHEKSAMMKDAQIQMASRVQLMGTFVREAVLRRDYAQIEGAILQWGKAHSDIQRLLARTGSGLVIGEYKKAKVSPETFTVTHEEKIPGINKTIVLELEQDLAPVYSHIRQIVIHLAITWACLSLLLGLCLWWILNVLSVKPLKNEINARKRVEAELQKARDGLEVQVKARTAELSEVNIDLEKEIAERKQAETEAQQAHRNLENIFQAMGHPVMILDPAHGVISANRATIELIGGSEKELIGKRCYEIMHGTKKPPAGCPMHKMMASGCRETGEMEVESFGRIFSVTCTPVNDQEGKLQKCIHIATDITQQKQAEAELRKYRENLERLVEERTEKLTRKTADLERTQTALQHLLEDLNLKTDELAQANERLQELDRLKSMFIASMSHELRTPLNSIIGFTGIILQGMSGEINNEQRDQLQRVYGSGKHLLALITDVIDISKIEAGKTERYVSEFNLAEVIQEAAVTIQPEIEKKDLMLEVKMPVAILLKTDRRRLLQCILNLLSNAVKYTEKGTIRIETRAHDERIDISVSDTGIGIRNEDLPILFQSFVRLESHLKIKAGGTGLGLYLIRKIASDLLGGTVSAQSTLGEGSTFVLTIPQRIDDSGLRGKE